MRVHCTVYCDDRKMQLPWGDLHQDYVARLPCIVVHWQKAGAGKKAACEGVIIAAQSITARNIKHATGGGKASADQANTIQTRRRATTV